MLIKTCVLFCLLYHNTVIDELQFSSWGLILIFIIFMKEINENYKVVISKKETDDYSSRFQKVIWIILDSFTKKRKK